MSKKKINLPGKQYKWYKYGIIVILCAMSFVACSTNENRNVESSLEASFTEKPLPNNPNKVAVKNTSKDANWWSWNFGNGLTSVNTQADTITYFNKGQYKIELRAFGYDGFADSASETVKIAKDLYFIGENILKDNGALVSKDWEIFKETPGKSANITFSNNTVNFKRKGGYSNTAIYQAVHVNAGFQYRLSANVQGSGATNAWLEVFLGTTKPVKGKDYKDNEFLAINTYSGCGQNPFNTNLNDIACEGSGVKSGGLITFHKTGIAYLLIKVGCLGSNGTLGKDGITIKNISLKITKK